MDMCEVWLKELLAQNKMVPCEEVRAQATLAGFKKRELRAARYALGVELYHKHNKSGEEIGLFWFLPQDEEGETDAE